jgi:hypothetical protein
VCVCGEEQVPSNLSYIMAALFSLLQLNVNLSVLGQLHTIA